jgi:hypothetical protein
MSPKKKKRPKLFARVTNKKCGLDLRQNLVLVFTAH